VDELNVAVGIARTFAEEVGAGQDAEVDPKPKTLRPQP
jgi:hypothetical protein